MLLTSFATSARQTNWLLKIRLTKSPFERIFFIPLAAWLWIYFLEILNRTYKNWELTSLLGWIAFICWLNAIVLFVKAALPIESMLPAIQATNNAPLSIILPFSIPTVDRDSVALET